MGRKEKMVFRGEIYRIYQWRQKLYDGSYATFERAERPSVVQILCIMDNSVLLAKEEQPEMKLSINMFGGVIEEGEHPLEAAKRELLEEAGITAKSWILLKTFAYGGKLSYKFYLYAALNCTRNSEQKLDPGEKIKVIRMPLNAFMRSVKRMRMNADIKLYFTELRYQKTKMRNFEKQLGLRKQNR
ncbi:MAG: NUDIX domain-containing protein [Candidatus Marsarchaeota archaeon]|jgi:ADP-ribose pyrophosphatase|nr:NUDIX domain-containing protein [Candidatus Marsarchaeota archaeon]